MGIFTIIKSSQELLYKKSTIYGLSAVIWLLVISTLGYQYGRGDQTELLPYIKFLNNNELYPKDLYIQTIINTIPNERIVLAEIVAILPGKLGLKCFLLFCISGYLIILGLLKIADHFIKHPYFASLAIIFLFWPLYGKTLGGNELYYNFLCNSLIAKTFAIWGIYWLLKNRFLSSGVLIFLAGLFHPVVGIQLLIIASVYLIFSYYKTGSLKPLRFFIPVVAGLIPWLIWLVLSTQTGNEDLFIQHIMFRVPHHFDPNAFQLKHYLLFGLLSFTSIAYFFRRDKAIVIIIICIILGCVVYSFLLKSNYALLALKTQWFKSTIWLEMWGCIAVVGWVQYIVNRFWNSIWWPTLLFLFLISSLLKPRIFARDFPWNRLTDPDIILAKKIKQITNESDLFLIPFGNETFRFFAERSVYVDFKSIAHHPEYFKTWAYRIKEVYGIDYTTGVNQDIIERTYRSIEAGSINVDYLVTYANVNLKYRIIAENNQYKVYQINGD